MLVSKSYLKWFLNFYALKIWDLLLKKGLSTLIHIGPGVSFTLGWVGDVSRIMQYIVLFGTFSWLPYVKVLLNRPFQNPSLSGILVFSPGYLSWVSALLALVCWGFLFFVKVLVQAGCLSWPRTLLALVCRGICFVC